VVARSRLDGWTKSRGERIMDRRAAGLTPGLMLG
jgi:hypothetical protein